MKYLDLKGKITGNMFTHLDVRKLFPEEKPATVRAQLFRFARRNLLTQIKRGLYCFDPTRIDELELAHHVYAPSYVSLETALNYYGMLPDIPAAVTSVTTTTTKHVASTVGRYSFVKIKKELYWGYLPVLLPHGNGYFPLAEKEKALLDFFYIRKVKQVRDLRLNLSDMNMARYRHYAKQFPPWVETIHR